MIIFIELSALHVATESAYQPSDKGSGISSTILEEEVENKKC